MEGYTDELDEKYVLILVVMEEGQRLLTLLTDCLP